LREALRAVERDARRDRLRTLAWRFRPTLRRAAVAGGIFTVLGAATVWHGWPAGRALPRVVHGEASTAGDDRISGRAVVVDGDTLVLDGERLRLNGIDAPELGQTCEVRGGVLACGAVARDAMAAILAAGAVSCLALDTDRYGRRVVRCHNDRGQDVAAELVRQGWATAFRRYSEEYVGEEAEARAARRGMWAGRFEDPAAYRARGR
jgi:endonuclease YncB( thermonuclease family)